MIQHNYFEIFQLPQAFDLDQAALATAYRTIQQQVHPDKFAAAPAAEQRMAVQFAALVNQAFDTLRQSVKRAEYLLGLAGQGQSMQNSSTTDSQFLLQQMQWREQLADCQNAAEPLPALEALRQEAKAAMTALEANFSRAYSAADWPTAQQTLGKLMFVNKLLTDIHQLEDQFF